VSTSAEAPLAPQAPEFHLNLLGAIQGLLVVIVLALFVLTFLVQPFRIPSESMEPTLLIGDFVLVDKVALAPAGMWSGMLPYRHVRRGDVIVFHRSSEEAEMGAAGGTYLVKRVTGVPGDHVRLQNGRTLINGMPQAEPFALFLPSGPDAYRDEFPRALYADEGVEPRWWVQMHQLARDGELIVPENEYFVLGDNRNHSVDSRYWGLVDANRIAGRALMVYFSVTTPSPDGGDRAANSSAVAAANDRIGESGTRQFARWHRMFRVIY
jgi:signal peptidase I